jgi:hypothetical protein
MNIRFCEELKVIPQYVGSCWFNAFLMVLLYSFNARKAMIRASKKWNKSSKLLNIFKTILKKNYNDPSIAEYYKQIKPELILFKFLKEYAPDIEKIIKEKIVKDFSNFGFNMYYFTKFLKHLKLKCLDISYDVKNGARLNIDKSISYKFEKNSLQVYVSQNPQDDNQERKEIQKIIDDVPDFLILYHENLANINLYFRPLKTSVFKASNYGFDENEIANYKDEIHLNEHTYKLDSCLLGNFNKYKGISHAIAGITCKNNRYVYNGWINKTNDPAMMNKIAGKNEFPCSLMKFDWDVKKNVEFCLNPVSCKLDKAINKKIQPCFSFGKGDRILVYVRVDDKSVSPISSISSSKGKISNLSDFVKDIYQIDDLTIVQIKKALTKFGYLDFQGKDKKELRNELMKILIKKYKNEKDVKKDVKKGVDKRFDIMKSNLLSRKDIYKKFKSFKDFKGKNLLKQQVFLADLIDDNYSSIDKMLLFHGIGTGKTCTSITIAEAIMKKDKKMSVLVILPARLKTNFIDELISETCGFNKYISAEDFKYYTSPDVSKKLKDDIRKKFMKKISENYEIVSYEVLRTRLLKSLDIKGTIDEITKNRVVIVDEIHNLITSKINSDTLEKIKEDNKIPKNTKNINGVMMRLMGMMANKSSKFFLLTATPIFDNYGQFIELVLNLNPDIKEEELKRNVKDLDFLLEKIKGKVSFYHLQDKSSLPKVITDNLEIPLSKTQDEIIAGLADNNDEYSNMFCVSERQISISAYGLANKNKVFSNLKEYAPKLEVLFRLLKLKGKHVIYSNFINYCLYLIAEYLKKEGWNDFIKDGIKKDKTFVIWDASLNDENKQNVKNVLNSVENMDGSLIKVILGSPSIKEGISFKHIQHLHQIDPVWNSSAKLQVEGRCVRFKSHEDIPLNHPYLKREVVIHNYISVARKYGLIEKPCDMKIYYEIIKKKAKVIGIIEKLLMKISIDYYLWTHNKSPSNNSRSSISSLSKDREELEEILGRKNVKERKMDVILNTCPKIRRPVDDKCINDNYPFLRNNKKGIPCCYKKINKKQKN